MALSVILVGQALVHRSIDTKKPRPPFGSRGFPVRSTPKLADPPD